MASTSSQMDPAPHEGGDDTVASDVRNRIRADSDTALDEARYMYNEFPVRARLMYRLAHDVIMLMGVIENREARIEQITKWLDDCNSFDAPAELVETRMALSAAEARAASAEAEVARLRKELDVAEWTNDIEGFDEFMNSDGAEA